MYEIDFRLLAIISPFVSATLAGFLSYYFSMRTKRFDILYQNKIPAFKEVVSKLVEYKKYCLGRIAFLNGHETSPYWEKDAASLIHRVEIASVFDVNSIFVSPKSKKSIQNLLDEMGSICSAEISNDLMPGIEKDYERISIVVESCIDTLYSDLNLKG
jgi:hypothetical protein